MAYDKSMPPSDPTPMPDAGPDMAPDMGATDMAPQGGGDGAVMVNMPRATFTAIHQVIVQLAKGLDALAMDIEGQAQSAGEGSAPAGPVAPAGPEAPMGGPEAPAGSDEADLANFAEMLNQRGVK
jgi:hypothetical protein